MAADNIGVLALARVLNQPSVVNGVVSVTSSNANAGINYLLKRYGGFTFLLTENDGLPQNQTAAADPISELSKFCVIATSGTSRTACTSTASKNQGSQHMLPAGGTTATFTLANAPANATATVLGENIHLSNLPTIGDVTPFVADPADYVSVCGGSFYYDSCGGGVGSLNGDGTFASPAVPYYFAPVGPNPVVYAQASEVGAPRTIPVVGGVFTDNFVNSYTRHIYQINFDPNPNAPLIGDVNGDGKVDYHDFLIVKAAMGTTAGLPGYDPRADVIRDGVVDSQDLALVGGNDTTPPVITPTISGPLGNNGWYVGPVTISWAVSDPETGIASSTGCDPTTLTADTPGVKLTCSATNGVGLSSSVSVTVKIDQTPPVISGMPAAGCSLWPPNGKMVQVATVTAADALSGLVPVIYTLNATAADQAGNLGSAVATCSVPHNHGHSLAEGELPTLRLPCRCPD